MLTTSLVEPTMELSASGKAKGRSAEQGMRSIEGLPTDPSAFTDQALDVDVHRAFAIANGDVTVTIERLIILTRERAQYQQAQLRLLNQLGALERSLQEIQRCGDTQCPDDLSWQIRVTSALNIPMDQCAALVRAQTKLIEKAVATLPADVLAWMDATERRGFGRASLGQILGACGNLDAYATVGKLWKRLGLAVGSDGAADRRKKGELTGYSPRRRALMHVIGECVLKGNRDGPYRQVYDQRKAYEMARLDTPENLTAHPSRLVAGKSTKYSPKLHAHRRAMRYMEKRLLRDLWVAWRALVPGITDDRLHPLDGGSNHEPR